LPIQVTGIETANRHQQETGIVKVQNRERQRKQDLVQKNRSGAAMPTSMSFKIWNTISQFYPYKNEILNVVKILNSIGANCNIIAATLGLQGWKNFYGGGEWTAEDVKGLLEGYRA
jgi:hypothetical protein